MGQDIEKEDFAEADYREFSAQLQSDLAALQLVLARPRFGAGETTIGAELELNLIDAAAQPLPQNREILATLSDPRVKLELDRFNLELHGSPLPLRSRPFSQLGGELTQLLDGVAEAARGRRGRLRGHL